MHTTMRTSAVVFALSLAIWMGCYYSSLPPLRQPETVVVVGAVFVMITVTKRAWNWISNLGHRR